MSATTWEWRCPCGYRFPAGLGHNGCPNCRGTRGRPLLCRIGDEPPNDEPARPADPSPDPT